MWVCQVLNISYIVWKVTKDKWSEKQVLIITEKGAQVVRGGGKEGKEGVDVREGGYSK